MNDDQLKFYLTNCPNLTGLKLDNLDYLPTETCQIIINSCPKLSSFECHEKRDAISAAAFQILSTGLRNLTHFAISISNTYVNTFSDVKLANIVINSPKLTHVCFSSCSYLTDNSMFKIAEHCPLLEHLNISDCFKVSDVGVVRILNACQHLNFVDLSSCSPRKLLTDDILYAFMNCPLLRTIKLINCGMLSDDGMYFLIESCPLLECVDLHGCVGLTDLTILALIKNAKHLKSIDVGDTLFTDFVLYELVDNCHTLTSLVCGGKLTNCLILRAMRGAKSVIFSNDPSVENKTLQWNR
jgi:hypothetical protein